MNRKPFEVKVKASPRARTVYTWTRFATDAYGARYSAHRAARASLGNEALVISVTEIVDEIDEMYDYLVETYDRQHGIASDSC